MTSYVMLRVALIRIMLKLSSHPYYHYYHCDIFTACDQEVLKLSVRYAYVAMPSHSINKLSIWHTHISHTCTEINENEEWMN